MSLPRYCDLNHDFYKGVLSGEKELFHVEEIKHIVVPKYPELSLKQLKKHLIGDKELARRLPDGWENKKKIERDWVLNIVNTVHPGFLSQLIRHA